MVRLVSLLGLFFLAPCLHAQNHVDALVKDALKQWQVPGVSLAIVQDDRVIYMKGHGVKELGKIGAPGPDTVFPIASCSKPFTSLAVGLMVHDGKMTWDDPVRKHVPFFRLSDPLADAGVSVRDLLTHRTGMGSHDMLWYKAPWDLEERIRKLAKLELESSFRSTFHYQTILFGSAGYGAGRASGTSWQDLIQRRILDALDMKSSRPVFSKDATDLASPHRKGAGGKVEVIARYPLEQPDPAGSIHASARDLARFLRFQLGDGSWQGKRLLAAEILAEMHTPQIVIRREGFARVMNPETLQISYGLGWIVQDYRGKLLLMHGGAIDGFRAHFTLVPQARLGIVLLCNLDRSFMNLALSNTLVDQFLGLPYKDWHAYYLDVQTREEAQEKERVRALRADRKPDTKPSLPLEAYAGKYHEPAYGTCVIRLDGDRLHWHWANLHCPLEHFQDDTFLANGDALIDASAEFRVGKNNQVDSLKILGRTFRRQGR